MEEPKFALIGAGLFLLSPYLFIDVFNASSFLPFDLLLPAVFLLAFQIIEGPWAKPVILLSLVLGLVFAIVPFGPVFTLPLLVLLPLSIGLTRRSVRMALRTFVGIAVAIVAGLFLNAPFFLGNLAHFTSGSLQPSYAVAASIVPLSYGFSAPIHFFSLLGAGLYDRYAGFYPPLSEALLVVFSAFALSGLLLLRRRPYRELGFLAGILYVSCAAWIFLTRAGITLALYNAFGLLTVLNYPIECYDYIVVSLTILATFALDRLAHFEGETQSTRATASSPDVSDAETPTKGPGICRLRRGPKQIVRRPLTMASCVLVLALLVIPAGFYLESGDFKVFDAPQDEGWPPQWGATVPSAYPAMYDFLESHGGTMDSRFLILPFPGIEGGLQFGPFAINTFGLPEYQGSTTAVGLFQGPRSSEYSTSVLNYLIENHTNRIGVLLGEASVKYVLVDLQANFTGPPTWTWDSLVGASAAFLALLHAQQDLEEVFSSHLFVAFLNLDYQPYVTGASGVVVFHTGNASVPLNHTIGSWPTSMANWSSPGPSSRIALVENLPSGYEVFGVNGSGVMNITFSNATDTITGSSTRLDNLGFYLLSNRIPVVNQGYTVQFHQNYTGPANHAGYVAVVGYDSNGTGLWGVPSYTVVASTQPNVTIPLDPEQLNSLTAYVRISIAFPYNFGSGTLTTYSVSNFSLALDLPSIPSVMLAALSLSEMPSEAAVSNYTSLPSFDFSSSTADTLARAGTPVSQLCFGLCSASTSLSDQLFFMYSALHLSGTASSVEATPSALAGEVVATDGALNASFLVNPSPFQDLALRASGNGSVTIANGSTSIARLAVSNDSLDWYPVTLASKIQTSQLTINVHGSVQLDSLWLGPINLGLRSNPANASAETTTMSSSLTEYSGTLSNATFFVVLSQGFDPSWSMSVDSADISSILIAGWANGFAIPRSLLSADLAYHIVFTAQVYHSFFVAVQTTALIVLLASFTVLSVPWLSIRLARARRRVMSILLGIWKNSK
ncbi:MAG TPA: hypothetical protein VGG32_00135 [Thermoplasmata archaeon]